jgi:hypothetical protein
MMHTVKSSKIGTRRYASGAAMAAFAIISASLFASTCHAESTGVSVCDDFLEKYTTCVTSKIPVAAQSAYKAQLDQTRKMWVDMGKNAGAKPAMEASCKQTMDTMKTALASYGCSF